MTDIAFQMLCHIFMALHSLWIFIMVCIANASTTYVCEYVYYV